jgi:hypothetical protein
LLTATQSPAHPSHSEQASVLLRVTLCQAPTSNQEVKTSSAMATRVNQLSAISVFVCRKSKPSPVASLWFASGS